MSDVRDEYGLGTVRVSANRRSKATERELTVKPDWLQRRDYRTNNLFILRTVGHREPLYCKPVSRPRRLY